MAYLPLSTANLPDPAIDPAQESSPEDYFGVDTYTGTGATHERSTLSFQPDMLWGKSRSNSYNHLLIDSVRGTDKGLFPDVTNAESTNTLYLSSFDSDGYTLGPLANFNGSGSTYVMWAWKANGSGVSNTDGSITSTVSANTTSGFSICDFTMPSGGTATIGHGLGTAPSMIILKARNISYGWAVYHESIGNERYLELHNTNAQSGTSSGLWNSTSPTADVFSVGTSFTNGYNYIAYCFHSVDGFSKCGSYVGNGSADGPFVHLGFKPAFIMTKRTDSTGDWHMYDAERDTYNVVYKAIWANYSSAEYLAYGAVWDFLSNGVKARTSSVINNASGGTYIYIICYLAFEYLNGFSAKAM